VKRESWAVAVKSTEARMMVREVKKRVGKTREEKGREGKGVGWIRDDPDRRHARFEPTWLCVISQLSLPSP
jgi:hypothetical protein